MKKLTMSILAGVTITAISTISFGATGKVNTDTARIRSEASSDSSIVNSKLQNEALDIIQRNTNIDIKSMQENLFQKPVSELHEITISLFKLYAALAFKTDNMNVWTAFFNEPLITIVLEEPDLRSFLIDYFPEGDVNRATIAGFISSYEDNLAHKIEKEKLEKERETEEEQALQKKQGIWIYLAVASTILFIVLITMPSDINLSEAQIITIGCMILSFGLSCLSRHLKIYAKREKSRKKILLSRILIVAVIISISIGWISFFSENTSDGIYTYVSLACCLMFTAISIITVLLDSNPIERIKRALHGK